LHGEYLKPSTTAKAVRDADGRVVLKDVPDEIRTSYNAWCAPALHSTAQTTLFCGASLAHYFCASSL
jgi:hypothetical protein